eukprot:g12414.t2
MIAGAAADGLLVQLAKAESEDRRGRNQTKFYMVSALGAFVQCVMTAFGFNGKLYTGSFDQQYQLSFTQSLGEVSGGRSGPLFGSIQSGLLCAAIFMVPSSATALSCVWWVREVPAAKRSMRNFWGNSWRLLESRAFIVIAAYLFMGGSIFSISSNAGTWVSLQWAGVKMLQILAEHVLGADRSEESAFSAAGHHVHACWDVADSAILFFTSVITLSIDAVPQFLTIFNVFRRLGPSGASAHGSWGGGGNQYFYLGEPIVTNIPLAIRSLVASFVANEVADENNCALDEDSLPGHAWEASYLLAYVSTILSFATLPLLPWQKKEAQRRKQEWPHRRVYAIIACLVLFIAFLYILTGDILVLDPDLSCLRFLGGTGAFFDFELFIRGRVNQPRWPLGLLGDAVGGHGVMGAPSKRPRVQPSTWPQASAASAAAAKPRHLPSMAPEVAEARRKNVRRVSEPESSIAHGKPLKDGPKGPKEEHEAEEPQESVVLARVRQQLMETEAALAALEQEGLQEPNEPVEARAFAEGKKEMPDDEDLQSRSESSMASVSHEEPWERWDEMPIPEAAEMDDRPKVPSPKVRWPKEPGQAWPLPASCAVGVTNAVGNEKVFRNEAGSTWTKLCRGFGDLTKERAKLDTIELPGRRKGAVRAVGPEDQEKAEMLLNSRRWAAGFLEAKQKHRLSLWKLKATKGQDPSPVSLAVKLIQSAVKVDELIPDFALDSGMDFVQERRCSLKGDAKSDFDHSKLGAAFREAKAAQAPPLSPPLPEGASTEDLGELAANNQAQAAAIDKAAGADGADGNGGEKRPGCRKEQRSSARARVVDVDDGS